MHCSFLFKKSLDKPVSADCFCSLYVATALHIHMTIHPVSSAMQGCFGAEKHKYYRLKLKTWPFSICSADQFCFCRGILLVLKGPVMIRITGAMAQNWKFTSNSFIMHGTVSVLLTARPMWTIHGKDKNL